MKKIISLIMTLCLLLSVISVFASCDDDNTLSLDTENFGNKVTSADTSEQTTSAESSAQTSANTTAEISYETTDETTDETHAKTSDTEETTEGTEKNPETTAPEGTEKNPETTAPEGTTTERTAEWPTEKILAQVGVGVPDYEGYFSEIYTMESVTPMVQAGIEISIVGADADEITAYEALLVQSGYRLVNDEYFKERADGTTLSIKIDETIEEEGYGFEFSISVYKSEGSLSAWPAAKIAEALGDGITMPVITGSTSYDIDVIIQNYEMNVSVTMVALGCYGSDADDVSAYKLALMTDGFTESDEESGITYTKTINDGRYIIMCMIDVMPTNDGVFIAFMKMFNPSITYTLPENIKIEYTEGGEDFIATKIGNDYLLQGAEGSGFFKYDSVNKRWDLWMKETGSDVWAIDENYSLEDVDEVEDMVFSFIVNSVVIANVCDETSETKDILGIEAKKYTMLYEDVYTLYLFQDPETKLVLENGIVGLELASSKVTAIDKSVTAFDIQLPN